MKTIAQQLEVKNFPFIIKDDNDERIYYENSRGYWCKTKYVDDIRVYYEDSDGVIEQFSSEKIKAVKKLKAARNILEQAEKELKDIA